MLSFYPKIAKYELLSVNYNFLKGTNTNTISFFLHLFVKLMQHLKKSSIKVITKIEGKSLRMFCISIKVSEINLLKT